MGTIASFVGYNTHINNLQVSTLEVPVNTTHLQGFWAFETQLAAPYDSYNQVFTGQVPADATTVVNPFPNAPIPAGSCVVAGSLDLPLSITGEEQEDVELTLSFSINGSFEWVDHNGNGEWDIDVSNGSESEPVVDMGLRGLKANQVFHQFRSEFIGKASPVHLFWGAFDLAVTRFSGSPEMGEFFLKYEDVQQADNPEKMLHDFLQTTYQATVNTSDWDSTNLLRSA
ncbi:MAG: DUF5996 family protein [Bacteroidota bacterium]